MRRNYFKSPFATFFLIQFICLSTILIINGCRKADVAANPPTETAIVNNIEQKFFNDNAPITPLVKALNGFLQRENDTLKFVEKTVRKIGYPRWDKAVTVSNSSNIANRGNSGDSLTVTYIPFVRDSQIYVNAAMAIFTTSEDTTFIYYCDWQYKEHSFTSGVTITDSSAEKFALFFIMILRLKIQSYLVHSLLKMREQQKEP